MSIKNAEIEALANEISRRTGESKTEVIRKALLERRDRLALHSGPRDRGARLMELCRREIWPAIPKKKREWGFSRRDEDRLLGYGPSGV